MTAAILLTGGTGTLGSHIVPRLRAAGQDVRVLSRSKHEARIGVEYVTGDLAKNQGVEAAVAGVETIIHAAGSSKGDELKTSNLVEAAARAGVRHIIYISVVGADIASFGYFAQKLASERIIADSGIPWTTLRATQFHDLVLTVARGMARMPVVPVPTGFRFQPIDADEVAARLVGLSAGRPRDLVPDMAGPNVHGMDELIGGYLRAAGKRRPVVHVRLPGKGAKAFRAGANLAPSRAVGKRTWEEFLADRVWSARIVAGAGSGGAYG